MFFTDLHISIAGSEDVVNVVTLLNSAYRGEASKTGWTTEAHLIDGDIRSDEFSVENVMNIQESVILKYENNGKELVGCVNLQKHNDKIYLGMFAVSPLLQGAGIGKKLLKAAEEYAIASACKAVYMTVISVRTELVDWYNRHGYADTGERKPFTEDGQSGRHLQPLEFMVLEKKLSAAQPL